MDEFVKYLGLTVHLIIVVGATLLAIHVRREQRAAEQKSENKR